MDPNTLKILLESVKDGGTSIDAALSQLKNLPFEELGFAKVDHHRQLRTGFPEVIFCQGKTPERIAAIIESMMQHNTNILATRADVAAYEAVRTVAPEAVYHTDARIIVVNREHTVKTTRRIAVVTAGTSDIPVAEEAAITAETMGNPVDRVYDVGVAGIHRLFARIDVLSEANVLIVAAGMEGALASVIGGLVSRPVIAVPTSVGYGASFGGVSALLTMLNSCATGVSVVNIDNGFGAGYMASLINQTPEGRD